MDLNLTMCSLTDNDLLKFFLASVSKKILSFDSLHSLCWHVAVLDTQDGSDFISIKA